MEPQKQKPEILREKPSYIAVREHKSTDDVPLKLVSEKEYKARSHFKMAYPDTWPKFFQIFFFPDPLTIQNSFALRLIATVVMAVFTMQVIVQGYGAWIYGGIHHLNMIIHQVGHTIFIPAAWLGYENLMYFMGSGLQVLVPLVVAVVYWIQNREIMGTAFVLWWTLENLLDVAEGIANAKALSSHDWNLLLTEWGHLQDCVAIADFLNAFAKAGMVLCVLWTSWSLLYYWIYQRK
ncbi:MAG: hypothetical protein J6Y88_04695 [Bacteroidales bacterium]|nr:hypothetical protein [Bacteroidales bacterium]